MILIVFLVFSFVRSYNNGIGKVPAMGWNSWNQFACGINRKFEDFPTFLHKYFHVETLILETMDGLIKNGLDKVGYKFVNLDDCWQLLHRDDKGHVVPDPNAFPNGIGYLSTQAHHRGLKFGLYTDIGYKTCAGRAGSYGYYDIDAATYAIWEVDYVKCEIADRPWDFYANFSQTGRPILFSLCNQGSKDPHLWAPAMGNSWRTTRDIRPYFESILTNVDLNEPLAKYAGNYNFNDPDMLEVGVVGTTSLTPIENKWCIMAAPLLLGLDLRLDIEKEILDIITNTEIIAINQDELGKQGYIVHEEIEGIVDGECTLEHCKWIQVWMKPLTEDRFAVMMFNHASKQESMSEKFSDEEIILEWFYLDLPPDVHMYVRDAWEGKDLGKFKKYFKSPNKIGQHDVMVLILTPSPV